jgi:hypothetical protein
MLNSVKNVYYRHTLAKISDANYKDSRTTLRSQSGIAGAAVAETIVLVPRMIVGMKTTPTSPSKLSRDCFSGTGIWGSLNEIVKCLASTLGAIAGAVVGFPAALIGAAIGGCDSFRAVMRCTTGFGYRLGIVVITLPIAASEVARSLTATGIEAAVVHVSFLAESIGETLRGAKRLVVPKK